MDIIMEFLQSLFKLSPLIGVLVLAIWYFYRKEQTLDAELNIEKEQCRKELASLNAEMRLNEKQNIIIITKLSDVVEKMIETTDRNFDDLTEDISDLRDMIKEKLSDIKNGQK